MDVRPLKRSMLHQAGAVLSESFWSYPEVVHVLPDAGRRRRVLARYLTADCVDALRFDTVIGAFHNGDLIGVSAWLPPGAFPLSRRREMATLVHLAPIVPWVLSRVSEVRRSQKAKDAGHSREPHVYLCQIGVSTRAQGSGAGSALMRALITEAEAAGTGCYLTTSSEANTAWYGRFGFEVTEEFRPTPGWPRVWRMWRPAR
jgi:GNAT superfamily N-acetyltransferase